VSQQINLFNPILLKQKKHFSAVTMAQGLGLILIGAIVMSGFISYQLTLLSKEAAATGSRLVAAQAQLDVAKGQSAPRQKSKSLEDEIQQTEAEVKSLQQAFDTLQKGDFGNTKGYSEYMRAFSRQIIAGIWLTGFTLHGAGAGIGLQGRALQADLVPAYIGRLKREPVMQGKAFATLEMQTPQLDQPAKDNLPPKRVAAGYIEFSLQSAELPVVNAGVKSK
jgi:TolA-binding protein